MMSPAEEVPADSDQAVVRCAGFPSGRIQMGL